MPSTIDYTTLAAGRLASRLASGATSGASVNVIDVNGSPITFPTGPFRIQVRRKTPNGLAFETIGVASSSQSGSTVTLGTLTRQMSMTDGSTFSSGGNGYTFPANSEVYVSWDVFDAEQTAKKDIANTFSAKQTFSVPKGGAVYATFGDLPAGGNGDEGAYVTADGQFYDYIAGSWQARASGTNPNMSTIVAGKAEAATVAEQASHAATGATGALAVPTTNNLVTLSSDLTWISGAIPTLNTSKFVDPTLLGSGTPSSSTFLRGDSAWVTTPDSYFGTGADGALNVTSGTTTLDFNNLSILIKNYSSINISAGATLAVSNVPAAGGLLVLLCQGNVTIAGTINLSGKGSSGGAAIATVINGVSNNLTNGNNGSVPYNNFQQTRSGGAGNGASSGGTNAAAASGGGGGANVISAGTASSAATSGAASAAASTANVAITTSILTVAASTRAMTVGPGAGGGSGGSGWEVDNYTSGSTTYTSGAGGAGGGGLYISCGGNYTDAGGTINLSAADGVSASNSGTLSATNYSINSGGGGGGAGGTGLAVVRGTITATGTYTVSGGTGGVGESLTNGGHGGAKSDGGAGANGLYIVTIA